MDGRFPKFEGDVASPDPGNSRQGGAANEAAVLLPAELTSPDFEIEGVLSPRTADLMHVGVGGRLVFFSEGRGNDPVDISIRIVGLIEPNDPQDEFWFLRSDMFDAPARGWHRRTTIRP